MNKYRDSMGNTQLFSKSDAQELIKKCDNSLIIHDAKKEVQGVIGKGMTFLNKQNYINNLFIIGVKSGKSVK